MSRKVGTKGNDLTKIKITLTGKKITLKFPLAEKYKVKVGSKTETVSFGRLITFMKKVKDDSVLVEAIKLKNPRREIDLTIDHDSGNSSIIVIATSDDLIGVVDNSQD